MEKQKVTFEGEKIGHFGLGASVKAHCTEQQDKNRLKDTKTSGSIHFKATLTSARVQDEFQ